MQTLEIKVEQDHIESISKVRNPIIAIEELIWNGLDADADKINVKLVLNNIDGLTKIIVTDNGSGIPFSECEQAFGSLGGSAKSEIDLTPGGRVPHGKLGKGRFRAFGIGPVVKWKSRYKSNGSIKQFEIKGHRSSLRHFEIGDEKEVARNTSGVEVTIDNIETNFSSLMDTEKTAEELSKRLALYLRMYPGIDITYEKVRVDPSSLEAHSESYELLVQDKAGTDIPAELTVIEWKTPTDRGLYFCNESGFALEECVPGIQAPGFHFTAYLKSSLIPALVDDGAFAFDEKHPVVAPIIETAKDKLRDHFRSREASLALDLVKRWKEEKVYPYDIFEQDPLKEAEREVFDVCAVKVHEYMPSFERSESKNKQLTFRLIREALESNPGSLHKILQEVLRLPQEQQNDLASILDRTNLAAIINAAKTVVDRLDFINSLDSLLFGKFKKSLLERKQLHRILVDELWIFGEQYTLGNDDESLASLLEKHIEILRPGETSSIDSEGVKDLDGKQRIIDLMLHRQIPQLQPNHFEHLVVELKRPKGKLGQDEISQIENYAYSVANDERFDKKQTKWNFILIGNELSPFAEQRCHVQGKDFGHIYESDDGSINIFVKTWSTIIAEAKWRYEFFKKKLELKVTNSDGIRYLREKHSERLPSSTVTDQKGEL